MLHMEEEEGDEERIKEHGSDKSIYKLQLFWSISI